MIVQIADPPLIQCELDGIFYTIDYISGPPGDRQYWHQCSPDHTTHDWWHHTDPNIYGWVGRVFPSDQDIDRLEEIAARLLPTDGQKRLPHPDNAV